MKKQRIISLILVLCMCVTWVPMYAEAKVSITTPSGVNGSSYSAVYASKLDDIFQGSVALFSNSSEKYALGQSMNVSTEYSVANRITGYQCYIYANAVYYYLFGDIPFHGSGISGYWNDSTTVLTNQSSASYSTFLNAGVGFGAYIRTTSNSDGSYNGSSGHSMIVLAYDSATITYLDSNSNNKGLVRIAVDTWDEFNSSQVSGKSRKISHIVQCNSASSTAAPTAAYLNINKIDFKIGEEFTLTLSADVSCNYYLSIIDADSGEAIIGENVTGTYTNSFQKAGRYMAWMSAYNSSGGVDSNSVTFYVGEYTVKYDANGGSGAPSSQTKYYGKDIILSTAEPTRPNYNFLGWATSSGASTAAYQPGSSYSANADITLYAVWEHVCTGGHNYLYEITDPPTAYETGKLSGTCSRCSDTTTVTLPKLNTTDYSYYVLSAATCTENGTGRYTWKTTAYGTFYFDISIEKEPHSYSQWRTITAATCTADGEERHDCENCDYYETRAVNAPGHEETIIPAESATCTESGLTEGVYCAVCEATLTQQEVIPALGHQLINGICQRCSPLRGDLNNDGAVDDADVAQLLWHTLFPNMYAIEGNADFNDDGNIDDVDVAYLLWHTLFPDTYPL